MLPGSHALRHRAQPEWRSYTYFGWKWDVGNHRDAGLLGDDGQGLGILSRSRKHTHDIAAGGNTGSAICLRGRANVVVFVVVIDCTEIGDSEPTPTEPTLNWRGFTARRQNRGSGLRHTKADRQGFPPYMSCERRLCVFLSAFIAATDAKRKPLIRVPLTARNITSFRQCEEHETSPLKKG